MEYNENVLIPLCKQDLQLSKDLKLNSDYFKDFNLKSNDEKLQHLVNLIKRIKPYIDCDKYGFIKTIDESTDTRIGSFYNYYKICLNIYLNDTFVNRTGWSKKHGLTFTYFEKDSDENIYISSFSEVHPKKELKKIWEFGDRIGIDDRFHRYKSTMNVTKVEDYIPTIVVK